MTERTVFLAALELDDPAQRAAYVDRACAGAPELRARVETLLEAHQRPGRFLDGPAPDPGETVDHAPSAERPGSTVGPYKLLQQIGEGGMGAVFMAEQHRPVRRRVALKVMKPGMDSAQVIARFEAERQALALMDHQNIARVLDAGTTASGRPYFVMELVHGVPIVKYCDDNQLTLPERLELFVAVCRAIQHAHQKGVIHRDIKPSNVLVTLYDGKPVPKVIDFGVAKATEQALTERTMFTQYGAIVGTLEYMSPEQAEMSALGVDTRSDVYSLGVLLYELLTGSTPLERARLRQVGYSEILRKIREEEPERPSTRLSHSGDRLAAISAHRKTEPAKLARVIRGELDWIVMKALEKDRTRRYETANGLARDVQRYLHDEPVEACPPSAGYRLRKLLRRHRGPLAAAAAVLAALLVGLAATTALYLDARSARRAESAQRHSAERSRDAARREAARAETINRFLLNDVLSAMGPGHARGRAITVDELLRSAAERVEPAFRGQPEVAAAVHEAIGDTYFRLGRNDEAERHLLAALEVRRRLLGEEHRDTLRVMQHHAECTMEQGDAARAERLVRTALDAQRRVLGEEDPDTLASMTTLAHVLFHQGRLEDAESLARRTMDAQRRVLGEGAAQLHATRAWLMWVLNGRGHVDEAEALAREDLEVQLRARGESDYVTAQAMDTLGALLVTRGKVEEAEALFTKALATLRRDLGEEHPTTATAMFHLADALHRRGRAAEAEPLCAKALVNLRRALGADVDLTLWAVQVLGRIRRDLGQAAEAEALFRQTLETRRRTQGPDKSATQNTLIELVFLLEGQGRPAEAEPLLRELLAARRSSFGPGDARVADAERLLGRNLIMRRRYAEAEPLLRRSLARGEGPLSEQWRTYGSMCFLGLSLLGQGKNAEAEPLLARGYDGLRGVVPDDAQVRSIVGAMRDGITSRAAELYEAQGKLDQARRWREERGRLAAPAEPPPTPPRLPDAVEPKR